MSVERVYLDIHKRNSDESFRFTLRENDTYVDSWEETSSGYLRVYQCGDGNNVTYSYFSLENLVVEVKTIKDEQ